LLLPFPNILTSPHYIRTSLAYDPSKLTGIDNFVLNNNTIYGSLCKPH
jgi:hypothetical protein